MKKIINLALALILALSLAACSGNNNGSSDNGNSDGKNPSQSDGNNVGEAFIYGEDYINEKLGDYHIVYNVTTYAGGESDSAVIEQIKTSEGYYYRQDSDYGVLFIKNGNQYDKYEEYEDTFEKSEMTYDENTLKLMMTALNTYMTTYAGFGSSLSKSGSQTVAGRDCVEYKYDYNYPGYGNFKYIYCIDKETGVCLKFTMELNGAGEKIGYEFECTTFETSGVSLPNYK